MSKSVNLRKLEYSPNENPYAEGSELVTQHKTVRTRGVGQDLMNPETGEIVGMTAIHVIEEKDPEHFVKVFVDGVKASYDLTGTGRKIFQLVLEHYQAEKMTGGYSDCVVLYWFGEGLNGQALDISEKTFQRGLKELIEKGFLSPRRPNEYWVNPALFFKGDRVAFLREYRRRPTAIKGK